MFVFEFFKPNVPGLDLVSIGFKKLGLMKVRFDFILPMY